MDGRTTSQPSQPRRPNGRLVACDPCRKRKLACDHMRPVCSRCRKRKQDESCVYPVAPPKTSGPKSPLPSPAPSMQPTSARHRPPPSNDVTPALNSNVQAPSAGPGYLGPTSYCSAIEDAENTLLLLEGPDIVTPQSDSIASHAIVEDSADVMSPRIREMCLTVLENVPDPSKGVYLRNKQGSDSWVRPIAVRVAHSLYETYGDYFVNRSTARFEELARKFCVNTSRPFSDDEPDPERWVSQFLGENMRWELLGMMSVFWDFIPGRRTTIWLGKRSAQYDRGFQIARQNLRFCTEICKELSHGNSMMVYLSQRCTVVDSMTVGDANLIVWRSHAEVCSLITFLGFHAVDEKDWRNPTLSTEIKKRIYHHVYSMSMTVTPFTGRPPLISKRYSRTPLPLDIQDDILFSDTDTLRETAGCLDERGWNTNGEIYAATRLRARAILGAIREEILEIALSSNPVATVDTLLELRARELQAISEFPPWLRFDDNDLADRSTPSEIFAARVMIQLEHLQNMFFLERLLLRNGHSDKGDLLEVSYDLTWTDIDRLSEFSSDCEWLVMAYAVPGGGILCLELLKPTLHNRPHRDPRITRSSIIQKLSLLVGYLNWVSPSGPNGDLCSDAKSVIQRVLDQTLNAAPSVHEPPAVIDWNFTTQVDFDFDLLDTFDWNRPDFPSSQQSNQ
ncbi:hypothetical protein GGR53DRAFT_521185 [Hypoxylon sp. FL1150]|nr:hypothetical protein GGR53DRAFT_521185 [Hypoxylon sp. FL1150]